MPSPISRMTLRAWPPTTALRTALVRSPSLRVAPPLSDRSSGDGPAEARVPVTETARAASPATTSQGREVRAYMLRGSFRVRMSPRADQPQVNNRPHCDDDYVAPRARAPGVSPVQRRWAA